MHSHLPSPVHYREDINGLRSWAVLAVLLFHFSWFGLPGGYAGVDVFFVISGYLMTAIVMKGLAAGNFSFKRFYGARFRRIFPALLALILLLLLLGWFFLPTPDYQALANQGLYSLGGMSNVHFYREAGYFDVAAHEKWLLHTWSLGIEAQFYVVYPIILVLLWRFKPSEPFLLLMLLALTVLSLLYMLFGNESMSAKFYLFPYRAWELMVGGLVFFLARRYAQIAAHYWLNWLGWLLILVSFGYGVPAENWPGIWTLVPVLGAALVIFSPMKQWFVTAGGVQWLGDRSYSLYLWHWPFVVLLFFTGMGESLAWVLAAMVLSLLLAHFSYQYIESVTRQRFTARHMKLFFIGLLFTWLLAVAISLVLKKNVFAGRLDPAIEVAANEVDNKNPRRDECHSPAEGAKGSPGCVYGDGPLGAILAGDSFALSTVNPLKQVLSEQGKSLKLWSFSSCPMLLNFDKPGKQGECQASTQWMLEQLPDVAKEVPLIVVNSQSFLSGWLELNGVRYQSINAQSAQDALNAVYKQTYCPVAEQRVVYLMRPYPRMQASVPQTLSRSLLFGWQNPAEKINRAAHLDSVKPIIQAQDYVAEQCGVQIIDALPYYCDKQYCYSSKEGRPLYYDSAHFSEYGNLEMVPLFQSLLGRHN